MYYLVIAKWLPWSEKNAVASYVSDMSCANVNVGLNIIYLNSDSNPQANFRRNDFRYIDTTAPVHFDMSLHGDERKRCANAREGQQQKRECDWGQRRRGRRQPVRPVGTLLCFCPTMGITVFGNIVEDIRVVRCALEVGCAHGLGRAAIPVVDS